MLMAAEKTNIWMQAGSVASQDFCGHNTSASHHDNLLMPSIPPVTDRKVEASTEESHTYVQETTNRRSTERRN